MPELPDLQVFSKNLTQLLKGKKVKEVSMPVSKKLNVSVAELKKALVGKTVKQMIREGKELHLEFNNKTVLGIHLMLHGSLFVGKPDDQPKHTILELIFNDQLAFVVSDWQGQATITLNPVPKESPDALSKKITVSFLREKLLRRTPIKNILLDQKVIRGIGNAYADEILWKARISPFSISNKIPDKAIKVLASSIKSVLQDAEKQIRKDDPRRITGEKRDFLVVHNAKKKSSPAGFKIKYKSMGSRKTYFTDEQLLYQ